MAKCLNGKNIKRLILQWKSTKSTARVVFQMADHQTLRQSIVRLDTHYKQKLIWYMPTYVQYDRLTVLNHSHTLYTWFPWVLNGVLIIRRHYQYNRRDLVPCRHLKDSTQRENHGQQAPDTTTTSLLCNNNVATSFWRHNDVIIASCVRWDGPWLITSGRVTLHPVPYLPPHMNLGLGGDIYVAQNGILFGRFSRWLKEVV